MNITFKVGDTYKTAGGYLAKIVYNDIPGDYPILAEIDGCLYTYTPSGKRCIDSVAKNELDLVEKCHTL